MCVGSGCHLRMYRPGPLVLRHLCWEVFPLSCRHPPVGGSPRVSSPHVCLYMLALGVLSIYRNHRRLSLSNMVIRAIHFFRFRSSLGLAAALSLGSVARPPSLGMAAPTSSPPPRAARCARSFSPWPTTLPLLLRPSRGSSTTSWLPSSHGARGCSSSCARPGQRPALGGRTDCCCNPRHQGCGCGTADPFVICNCAYSPTHRR